MKRTLPIALIALLCGGCHHDHALFSERQPSAARDAAVGEGDGLPPAPPACAPPIEQPTCRMVAEETAPGGSVIDNFDDGDLVIARVEGRDGVWLQSHDDTPGARHFPDALAVTTVTNCGSAPFVRISGCGHQRFTLLRLDFHQASIVNQAYYSEPVDVSRWRGVSFWARSSTNATVRVRFPDVNTDPRGGVCNSDGDEVGPDVGCFNDFAADVRLAPSWQRYEVRFSELAQLPWFGLKVPSFEPRQVYGIAFSMPLAQQAPEGYEVSLDDLAFF